MMGNKVCIDGIWYCLNKEDKTASVTSSDDKEEKYQGEVVIPEVVVYEGEGYTVTEIGGDTFSGCSGLSSINIPDVVTEIGMGAFHECSGLTSITIPYSVKKIGSPAFSGCSGLKSIIVAENNAVYDSHNNCNAIIETNTNTLIAGCATTIIPESVKEIGSFAFSGCSGLTSITIPESVKKIGGRVFEGCSGLTSITIPENVTKIGSSSILRGSVIFRGCSGLKSIIVAENNEIYDSRNNCNAIIETNTNTLIEGCTTTIIPESVTKIGIDAFCGRSGLTTITIPKSVTKIGSEAFEGCNDLTSITVAENNAVYDSRNNCNAIIETNTNTLIAGCVTTIIPESVTRIGSSAFGGCSSLITITIPESVKEIGAYAFYGCSSLKSIIIPESVKEIGSSAFSDCSSLSSIMIPENVTKIESWTFSDCTGLTSIIIPESVTKIEGLAFYNCHGLTSITIPESVTEIEEGAFYGCSGLKSIIVVGKNAIFDSRNNCNAIIETNTNTLIAGCATTIIPESVTKIEDCAFSNCSNLMSITIPESVTEIGGSAFWDCSSLKEIYCYNFSKDWKVAFNKSLVADITLHVPKKVLGEDGFFVECSQCSKKSTCVLNSFKKIIPIEAKVKKIELPAKILLSEKSVHLLDPTITPSYATEQRLSWKSSNEEVAVVNSKGRVVALSSGSVTITAMATDGSGVCASCEIVVRRMVESIQLNQTSLKLVAGNAFLLDAIVTPKDAYDTSLTWSTTDDDIAMILGNGRVVAVSAGTATITAKANDGSEVTATCEVVVMET